MCLHPEFWRESTATVHCGQWKLAHLTGAVAVVVPTRRQDEISVRNKWCQLLCFLPHCLSRDVCLGMSYKLPSVRPVFFVRKSTITVICNWVFHIMLPNFLTIDGSQTNTAHKSNLFLQIYVIFSEVSRAKSMRARAGLSVSKCFKMKSETSHPCLGLNIVVL